MGLNVKFRNKQVKGGGGKFEQELGAVWDKFAGAIVTNVKIFGDEAARESAEELLRRAKADAPVGSYNLKSFGKTVAETQSILGSKFHVSQASVNKGHDVNVQTRSAKGRFKKAKQLTRDKEGILTSDDGGIDVDGGDLRDSGEVRVHKAGKGRKGYVVSFDTRRTNATSRSKDFNYAVIQNDDRTFRHKVGKAGYLTDNYVLMKDEILAKIADNVRRGIKEAVR